MCVIDTMPLETAKTNGFADRMLDMLNSASVVLMTSVGHRTGLFDTMATLPPSTSPQIAQAAGLDERYVREWLGAMVTGRVVEYDPETATYHLPPDHAACLTRAASPDNIAATCQYIPMLAQVEDGIVNCFREGGGVPYARFNRFQEIMLEESGQTVCSALLDSILPLAPRVIDALERGINVLDVGCGSGRALILMAQRFPKSRFVGYDISEEGIASGRTEAERLGLDNLQFEVKDVAQLDEPSRYGLITAFDAIHDQADPARVLSGIARSLTPDGSFLMQDIAGTSRVEKDAEHPVAPFLYTISCMHCMTVSLAAGGAGLGAMWGREKALSMLKEAGFTRVDVEQLPHDPMNLYFVAKR